MFVRSESIVTQPSKSPRWSVQVWNFSTIQPARPAGESVRAYAIVCGFVPWIAW